MLQKRLLGSTGLVVTEFCLGVLPMGPLQAGLPEEQCVDLIRCAMDLRVKFSRYGGDVSYTRGIKLRVFPGICQGCADCIAACPNGAWQMVDEKAKVDPARCLLCGYCSPVCPHFAIRVF